MTNDVQVKTSFKGNRKLLLLHSKGYAALPDIPSITAQMLKQTKSLKKFEKVFIYQNF